ncbi:MAG TPA: tetratricopeptide repeat protein [Kofleriaceae bacterium]|nr:tetratricopeptide repeat protein [Kofleriaceae bacterium]
MAHALMQRGEVGDEWAARDVFGLLHAGQLVRAVSLLGRTLGNQACDRHMAQSWGAVPALTPIARALARLPFRQVWTTFPGDLIERAMEQDLPDGWPPPRVLSWEQAAELDRRRRTVLKILGDVGSYVITPRSIRLMLARAEPLCRHLRGYYSEGSLVFVGFRAGDPDLSALLDRLLGQFEPPQSEHFLVASGLNQVAIDELMSEHEIQVINLEGASSEEEEREALLEFLRELGRACAVAGIGLGHGRPERDDLEGWLALLQDDPFDEEAAAHLAAIEEASRAGGEWERLVEVLMARVEIEGSAPGRASLLREVADVFETRIGDLPRAFTALSAALREDPSDPDALDRAEKLADDTGGWPELIGDIAQVAGEIEDREVAAGYWARLGSWYHHKLDHVDYALAAYRQAVKLDGSRVDARRGLVELCRQQQRWSELADQLITLVDLEPSASGRIELLLALGELHETQLASSAKAIEAYQRAVDVDPDCDDALAALERLHRKGERWSLLAGVLERRAELWEATGQAQRAVVARRELATLRAEKLGDVEGAIARHEAALAGNPRDVASLRALEDLYAQVGRTTLYLMTIERLCDAASSSERIGLLRRLAMESESREGGTERAIHSYERVLEADPHAEDALAGLERLYRRDGRWDRLAGVLERHAAAMRAPSARADKWGEAAEVYERELDDVARAVEAHQNALAAQPDRRDSLAALASLYLRTGVPARGLEVVVRHARLGGEGAADRWVQAAAIAAESLRDPDVAEQYLEKALALDPNHEGALIALSRVHQATAQWGKAAARLEQAAGVARSRLDRVEILMEAAATCDEKLRDGARALELWLAALELDPDHEAAGVRAAERLDSEGRWEESLPIREMLVRIVPAGDRRERARREANLARASAELGMRHKAVVHYRNAAQADPDSKSAAVGLASALHAVAVEAGGDERWREAEAAHRDALARHQTGLARPELVEMWHRLGLIAAARDGLEQAEHAFRRALERDPAHLPSLEGLVQLAERLGDWKALVAAKRELMAVGDEEARVLLLGQVGDVHRERLGDAAAALAAYQEGLAIRPGSFALLHKVLEVHSESKQWRRALETLAALVASETDPRRKAKYHFAAGAIARDEIRDPDLAIEQLNQALEDDPSMDRALRALEPLLRARGEGRSLARIYRRLIKRMGDDAPAEVLLPLWTGLGALCLEELGDRESAIAAFEVAASLEPDNRERHEQLVELYLESGEARRQDAIEELQLLVQADPDRVELYRALSRLYREEGESDKAFCLAQALVFLRAAGREEQELYERMRPGQLVLSRRRLTEELWQRAILHAREDRRVNAIFASLVGGIAASTAQPPAAFHLSARDRIEVGDEGQPVARLVRYAAGVLGIEPDPQLYVLPGTSDGLRVANTTDRGRLRPALLVGEGHIERVNERELVFDLGKRMAYLRPDRYVSYAMSTLPMLESAFAAALTASGVRGFDQVAPEAARLAEQLSQSVPGPVLAQVAAIARQAGAAGGLGNGEIGGWRTATDLTANRVGFILCNDLETAARRVAVESAGVSTLSAKDRLRDLLAYSVSELYFGVRRHLGLAIEARRSGAES